jgi:hypothetical protein
VFGGPADDAFTHADPQALGLGRMSDLKPHTQVVGPLIEKQDGEDLVINDRAHQVRGTVQQGLEIEGGVEGVRQPDEKLRLQRIHLDRARQGQSFRTGPVIAFKRLRSKSLRRFFTGLGIVLVARRSHTNIES